MVKLLGLSSLGCIYLAVQLPVYLKAAVKLLDMDHLPKSFESTLLTKFESEARALALLQHPNIVRLMKYGTLKDSPYLVTDCKEK